MENYTFKPLIENENDESSNKVIKSNYEAYTSDQTSTVGLRYDNLIPPYSDDNNDFTQLDPYRNQNIAGINAPNLVKEAEHKEEISTETFNTANLVTDPPEKFNENKFGVNAIPIDQDRTMLPDMNRYEAIVESINSQLIKQATEKPEFVIKKTSSWISRLIDNKGEDYITSGKLSIDEVSKNAERIIDDMIAGRIDYTKFGKYIIMPVFIETLINYCTNKLAINRAIQYSLGYVYNDYTNRYGINPADSDRINSLLTINDSLSRNITQAISIVNQDIAIYGAIYNKLQYVQSTKNASILFNLAAELNSARKQTRKRY